MRLEAACELLAMTFMFLWGGIEGHGRLVAPPGRASAWRYGFPTPHNYDDNGLNCGGASHQHGSQGGKCGHCGDPFDMEQPRKHENGGKYGIGVIVDDYIQGQVVQVQVEVTAPHLGYFEFRVCALEDKTIPATQECLYENQLSLTSGVFRYYPGNEVKRHDINVRLPPALACDHCVFQWRWHVGNSWGTDEHGSGIGFGPQEEFYSCADIKIERYTNLGERFSTTPLISVPNPPTTTTTTTTTTPDLTTGTSPQIVLDNSTTTTTTTTTPDLTTGTTRVAVTNPTAPPNANFKCHFKRTFGIAAIDKKLDELCTCVCSNSMGVCTSPVCFCL